jgi:hypothetical protein
MALAVVKYGAGKGKVIQGLLTIAPAIGLCLRVLFRRETTAAVPAGAYLSFARHQGGKYLGVGSARATLWP